MTSVFNDPVLIVGAGVAGLAVARALEAKGVPYRVFERQPSSTGGGLAVNLPGNAIRALSELGLSGQLDRLGRPVGRREYRTSGDKLLFQVNEDAFWGEDLRPRSVRRADLLSALSTGLPEKALSYATGITSLKMQGSAAAVGVTGGTTLIGSLVVGADGVHSLVRRTMFGTEGHGHAVLADSSWRFMAPNPGIDCWTVWAGAGSMILLMPVGESEVYGWAAVTAPGARGPVHDQLALSVEGYPSRVQEAVHHALARPESLHHSPLEEVRLPRWHKDFSVLAGDAAHATAPVWAEGVALALEDSLVLASELCSAPDIPAALARYEVQRRPRVAHVQRHTDAMSRTAKLPSLVRNMLLPFVGSGRYRKVYEPLKEPLWRCDDD